MMFRSQYSFTGYGRESEIVKISGMLSQLPDKKSAEARCPLPEGRRALKDSLLWTFPYRRPCFFLCINPSFLLSVPLVDSPSEEYSDHGQQGDEPCRMRLFHSSLLLVCRVIFSAGAER